ncbi:MAG: HAD-IIIA family hydrolase [Candidatus Yonathbacteria bacterium]|nr:HAD-IIIA family hydrolase [Candidatus Yonathbacteria bacterium]
MGKSKKIAFLDRDGVINKKAEEHYYITRVEDFIFNEGIFGVVSKLKNEGFEFIVITNQRGVARGLYTEETVRKIHRHMKDEFYKKGIEILDILYCPHENNTCECRKPKDGMLREAMELYKFDKTQSLLISDSVDDVYMGEQFGLGKSIFVQPNKPSEAMIHLQKSISVVV